MSAWTVYWLLKLDTLQCFFGGGGFGIILVAVGAACVTYYHNENYYSYTEKASYPFRKYSKLFLWIVPFGCILIITSVFMPDTKTMAAIIVLPKIASAQNLDMVSKDAGDIYKLAMVRLKDALGEVK